MNEKKNSGEKKKNFIAVLKKYFRKEDLFLLPNMLCYLRILLIPAILCCYLLPITIGNCDKAGIYLSVGELMIAAYSDFLDGYIARTYDMKSNLGKVLDPIADKLLQFAIGLAILIKLHSYPSVYLLFGVFIGKELTLVFEDIFLAQHNRSYGQARWYGKVSTFIFYLVAAVLLLGGPFFLDSLSQHQCHFVIDSLCTTSAAFLLLAWILYLILYFKLIRKGENEVSAEEIANHREIPKSASSERNDV